MLELKNIHWKTPDGEEILKGIDLNVPEGKLTVITGPNGGGKTSLAKVIAGLYEISESQTGRAKESLMLSSSPSVSRAYRSAIFWSFPEKKSFLRTSCAACFPPLVCVRRNILIVK